MTKRPVQPLYTPLAMTDAQAAGYLAMSVEDFKALKLPILPYRGMHNCKLWATETLNEWFDQQCVPVRGEGTFSEALSGGSQ